LGEPNKAAEIRLRAHLSAFRTIATMHERTKRLVEQPPPKVFKELVYPKLPKFPPELEKKLEEMEKEMASPGGIWSPEAITKRRQLYAPLIEKEAEIKERLLAIEQTFIEKGWHLPKWERPSWLLE
ncbi:unnamed protein product, partial [marine sediment metagenome]